MQTNSSQAGAVAPADGRLKVAPTYFFGLTFLVCLYTFTGVLAASRQGLALSPIYIVAEATAAVVALVVFIIPAGLITAIGSIWVKQGRGRLFVRSHFFLSAIFIPMAVMGQLMMLYAAA